MDPFWTCLLTLVSLSYLGVTLEGGFDSGHASAVPRDDALAGQVGQVSFSR
jgi:hypothetical protein